MGTCNGAFSGKVVVGSDQAIKGLSAKVGELKSKDGGTISASAVEIRYAKADWHQAGIDQRYLTLPGCFAGLEETPPSEVEVKKEKTRPWWAKYIISPGVSPSFGAVVSVWVTVNVPKDAALGDYEGKLTITATDAGPVEVPVSLKVCGWKLPDPHDFATWVDIIQSPETVAMRYNVPLWSDEHFKYLEKSLKLLGQVGNKATYIHLICETNAGNAETMVRWIKQEDETYKYDFKPMDRYLDLVEKYFVKPPVVCFYVWDTYLEGGMKTYTWEPKKSVEDRKKHEGKGPLVSVLDPAAGKVEMVCLPQYSSPESKKHWQPLMESIRERLKKRGWEKAMALGVSSDYRPAKGEVMHFKEIVPDATWVSQSHGMPTNLHGVPVKYLSGVWAGGKFPKDPSEGRTYGWKRAFSGTKIKSEDFSSSSPSGPVLVHFPRSMYGNYPITTFRFMGEMNIAGCQRGFARFGADFWAVRKDSRGRWRGGLSARYAKTQWRNLNIRLSVFSPGKDGAISTQRFEMLREGIQECEARIFIEKALTDENLRAKLGEELAKKSQAVLDERIVPMRMGASTLACAGAWTSYAYIDNTWWQAPGVMGYYWYVGSGWQERSEKLYSAAAEVAEKLEVK